MGLYLYFLFFFNIRGVITTYHLQPVIHKDSLKNIPVFCWCHYFSVRYLRIVTTEVSEESTEQPYSDRNTNDWIWP